MEKELNEIKYTLYKIAERESLRLFRLARRMQKHGCSSDLVSDIRNEGLRLHCAYPAQVIDPIYRAQFKYAFH